MTLLDMEMEESRPIFDAALRLVEYAAALHFAEDRAAKASHMRRIREESARLERMLTEPAR